MFNKLYNDVFLLILFNLTDIYDIISLSESNNYLNDTINDDTYFEWARYLYSKDFWNHTIKRTPLVAKPLPNMKIELLRIKNFNKCQIKYGKEIWTKDDYYKYWVSMEDFISKGSYSNKSNTLSKQNFTYDMENIL